MFNKISKKLQLYRDNKLNVLLIGKAGIGKTAVVKKLFEEKYGENYKYFSTATLDPWVDFCGIPQKVEDQDGAYLDMVMPKHFRASNQIQAIFLDEFNRSQPKIRNATMELLQFKSINGQKFDNLELIWAAINPEEGGEYDVDKLDPAIKDRFHVIMEIPYLLDEDYFKANYPDHAPGACEWWNNLDKETKKDVSPRRLEYALQVYSIGGDLRDILPKNTNIGKLTENLKFGTMESQIKNMMKETDEKKLTEMLSKSSNLMNAVKEKLGDKNVFAKVGHLIPEEILVDKAQKDFTLCDYINSNKNKFSAETIVSLEKMGCFKKSAFAILFHQINAFYPKHQYISRTRNNMRKVLSLIPDMQQVNITKNEVTNLQNFLNLIESYLSHCQTRTVMADENKFNFDKKLSELNELNNKHKYGLTFGWRTSTRINTYDYNIKYQKQHQAYATTQTYTATPTYSYGQVIPNTTSTQPVSVTAYVQPGSTI